MRSLTILLFPFLYFMACGKTESKDEVIPKKQELVLSEPIDSTLKKKLRSLGVKDQTLRFMLPEVANKFGSGSEEENYFWTLIHRQDSINELETLKILEEHGWVGKSRVGEEANQALWLVIQHAPVEVQEKYLPLLRKSVAVKESEGWHLAFLEDRVLMYNDKKQIYGSQAKWDKVAGKMKIHPIEDVENVNERRATLGLEPIEEYVKMNGYIFDQNK